MTILTNSHKINVLWLLSAFFLFSFLSKHTYFGKTFFGQNIFGQKFCLCKKLFSYPKYLLVLIIFLPIFLFHHKKFWNHIFTASKNCFCFENTFGLKKSMKEFFWILKFCFNQINFRNRTNYSSFSKGLTQKQFYLH